MAHEVIMPALGMAQETGLILAWRKQPGEAVKAGDVLMEVETDKAAMEVEAQADGYLTEVRRGEGEDVPVGEVIAVISETADAVEAAPAATRAPQAAAPSSVPPAAAEPAAAPGPEAPKAPEQKPTTAAPVDGRLLASPKAKRLAAERGLDLARLARAGHPQPYHVADLKVLDSLASESLASESLAGEGAAQRSDAAGARLMARASVAAEAFDAFCAWAQEEAGAGRDKVLAVFAAGSLRKATGAEGIPVLVLAPRMRARLFADAECAGLAALAEADGDPRPELVVHDLTATRLLEATPGAADGPVLTVARDGARLVIGLTATVNHLDDEALIICLDAFAGRLEEPLRHLI